ncbi:hypothetical protein ACLKA6_008541 [Drosophila palustris]
MHLFRLCIIIIIINKLQSVVCNYSQSHRWTLKQSAAAAIISKSSLDFACFTSILPHLYLYHTSSLDLFITSSSHHLQIFVGLLPASSLPPHLHLYHTSSLDFSIASSSSHHLQIFVGLCLHHLYPLIFIFIIITSSSSSSNSSSSSSFIPSSIPHPHQNIPANSTPTYPSCHQLFNTCRLKAQHFLYTRRAEATQS